MVTKRTKKSSEVLHKQTLSTSKTMSKPQKTKCVTEASEIDHIFQAAKPKQHTCSNTKENNKSFPQFAGEKELNKEKQQHECQATQENKDDIFGEHGKSNRKFTEEGYPIYTEEELGFRDNYGYTDQCPFDCDCCF